jgi:hypothetical protein
MATHLIRGAYFKDIEKAVVISHDLDLVAPIQITTKAIELQVIVVNPFERNGLELKSVATGIKQIRKGLLKS